MILQQSMILGSSKCTAGTCTPLELDLKKIGVNKGSFSNLFLETEDNAFCMTFFHKLDIASIFCQSEKTLKKFR